MDYVKLDGCYSEPKDMDTGYPEFGTYLRMLTAHLAVGVHLTGLCILIGMYLNKTQRPMVYSCSWPAYQVFAGQEIQTIQTG